MQVLASSLGLPENCMYMLWTVCYLSSPVYLRGVCRRAYALGNAITLTRYKKSKMLPVSPNCYLKTYLSPLSEWSVHSLTKLPFSHVHTFVHITLTLNAFLLLPHLANSHLSMKTPLPS